MRKRGKIQYAGFRDNNGKWQFRQDENKRRIPLVAQGDTIRGQLHLESIIGKIRKQGEYVMVERYPISAFTSTRDCKNIVDEKVKEIVETTLEKRMSEGKSFEEAKLEPIPFPSGKALIKKVRCKVVAGRGYLTPEKALELRKHTFLSKHEYKHFPYAQNSENVLCLYYEGDTNGKIERAFSIVGLLDLAKLKLGSIENVVKEPHFLTIEVGRGKNKMEIPFCFALRTGMKCIFYTEDLDELKTLQQKDLLKRLFRIYKFNAISSTKYLYLQNHIEARNNDELGDGDTSFDPQRYQARLKLSAAVFSAAIEGKDFEVTPAGEIEWKF